MALAVVVSAISSDPSVGAPRYRYTSAGASYNLAGILGGAMPPLVAARLAAIFGSFAETKDRDLRRAQPATAAHRWLSSGHQT